VSDGHYPPRLVGELFPSISGVIDDVIVCLEDGDAEFRWDTSTTRQRTHHAQPGSARFRQWWQTPFGAWRRVLSQPFQIEGRHQFGNAVGVAKCPRDMEAAVAPSPSAASMYRRYQNATARPNQGVVNNYFFADEQHLIADWSKKCGWVAGLPDLRETLQRADAVLL
jgi:hypothetical protein